MLKIVLLALACAYFAAPQFLAQKVYPIYNQCTLPCPLDDTCIEKEGTKNDQCVPTKQLHCQSIPSECATGLACIYEGKIMCLEGVKQCENDLECPQYSKCTLLNPSAQYSVCWRKPSPERQLQAKTDCPAGQTGCDYCAEDLFYNPQTTTCKEACAADEHQIGDNACLACYEGCSKCSGLNADDCLDCKANYFYTPETSECVQACKAGFYLSPSDFCDKCNDDCETCESSGFNSCLTCKNGWLMVRDHKTCIDKPGGQPCPDGFYEAGNQCVDCHGVCATCIGGGLDECKTCAANLFYVVNPGQPVSECVTDCHDGYYPDQAASQCKACDASCATCSGNTANDCLTCPTGSYYKKDTKQCVASNCPNGYYVLGGICYKCNPQCQTCFGPSIDQCSSCNAPFQFAPSSNECINPCGQGFITKNNECHPCDAACLTCYEVSDNDCTSCPANKKFVPSAGTCVDACDPGFYVSGANCEECLPTCQTCSTYDTCDACILTFSLEQDTKRCISYCRDGYYRNAGICKLCDDSCQTCSNAGNNNCESCPVGFLLVSDQKICTDNCPDGYYEFGLTCYRCHADCQTCTGPGSNECASCAAGVLFTPDLATCSGTCSLGFYEIGNECLACDQTCQSCNNPDSSDCLTCPLSIRFVFGIGQCVTQCPSNYYPLGFQCFQCQQSCTECSGGLATECTECTLPLILNPTLGTCEYPCSPGFFNDGVNCSPCDASCGTCTAAGITNCASCADPYALAPNNQCVANCGNKFYALNGVCQPCHETCLTCRAASYQDCLSCDSPYNYVPNLGTCLDPCPADGFFPFQEQCLACHSECKSCDGPLRSDCTSCPSPYFHITPLKQCTAQCPVDRYYVLDDTSCELCHMTCLKCKGPLETDCTECRAPLILVPQLGTCVSSCPSGFYFFNNLCQKCHDSCLTCVAGTDNDCTSCPAQSFLQQPIGQCLTTCDDGFFKYNGQCAPCNAQCKTCDGVGSNNCLSCNTPQFYTPLTKTCVDDCLPGYFQTNENQCHDCHPTCLTCTDQLETSCLTCDQGSFLLVAERRCVPECPTDTYKSGVLCIPCHSDCATCSAASSDNCLTCEAPRLFNPTHTTCQEVCAPGFYAEGEQCLPCDTACKECNGATETDCTACIEGKLLDPEFGTCVLDCGDKHYINLSTCIDCDQTCLTCDGPTAFHCLSCEAPLLFTPAFHNCVRDCAKGFFVNGTLCSPCAADCQTCSGPQPTDCLSCVSDKVLTPSLGTCAQNCLSPYYEYARQCHECNSKCATCIGSTEFECLTCSPGYNFLAPNTCTSACPPKTYLESLTGQDPNCLPCDASCANCAGPLATQCTECDTKTHYFFQNECKACPKTLQGLQGDQLFTVISSDCGSRIKSDEAAQESLQTEVITKYESYAVNGATTEQYTNLGLAARDLLLSMDAVTYKYTSAKTVHFKGVINSLADTWLLIDSGTPNGATVRLMIPKEVAALLPAATDNQVIGSVWRQGLYTSEDFGAFICPAVQIFIVSNSQVQSLKDLPRSIQLLIAPNGYVPKVKVGPVYWDGDNWAQEGLGIEARDQTAHISASHLTTFTLVLDLQGGVFLREAQNLDVLYTFIGVFLGVFFVAFFAALIYDVFGRVKGNDFYPHQKELASLIMKKHRAQSRNEPYPIKATTNHFFLLIFKYSLLYNLHLFNIFSYRDRAITSVAKTAWLFGLLSICYAAGVLIIHTDTLVQNSSLPTIFTFGVLLAILYIPNSFMVFMLTERAKVNQRYFVTKEETPTKRAAPQNEGDSTDRQLRSPHDQTASLMGGPVVTHIVRRKPSCRGITFFVMMLLIFYSLAALATVFLARDLLFKTTTRFMQAIYIMIGSFFFGWAYALIKATIASAVAVQFRRLEANRSNIIQPMGVQVFVDERTALIHEEFGVVLDYDGFPNPRVAPELQPYYPKKQDIIPEEVESSNGLHSMERNDARENFGKKLHQTSHFIATQPRANDDCSDFPEVTEMRSMHRSAIYPPRSPGLRSSQSRRHNR